MKFEVINDAGNLTQRARSLLRDIVNNVANNGYSYTDTVAMPSCTGGEYRLITKPIALQRVCNHFGIRVVVTRGREGFRTGMTFRVSPKGVARVRAILKIYTEG